MPPGTDRSILVTGASGFIGRACLSPLQAAGFAVHAVSSHPAGRMQDGVAWHTCDLLDEWAARDLLERLRPSHLLHLAWIASPGVFWTAPDNFRWVVASQALFRHFYRCGGERIVGVGSCAEYRWNDSGYDEFATPLQPETLYGRCKLATCLLLEAAAGEAGRSCAWARLFLPYGPGEAAGRLIPQVIDGLLKRQRVPCTHGRQQRDFIHVDDVAAGLLALVGSEAQGAYNLATGEATTLREAVGLIAEILGGEDLVDFGARPAPPGDPAYVVADVRRISAATGWRPRHTLREGLQLTIAASRNRSRTQEA